MSISANDKRKIDAAVEELYYTTEKNGHKVIEIGTTYQDTNEGLLPYAYDNRDIAFKKPENAEFAMIEMLREKISEFYLEAIWEIEDEIFEKAGFDPADPNFDEIKEYFYENYSIEPDYDHFFEQDMKINIMLGTDEEPNRDFVLIHEQYEALCGLLPTEEAKDVLSIETALTWLVKQQGYSMDDLQKIMSNDEYALKDGLFIDSVCNELYNMTNYMNTITVLTSVSMKDFAELMQPNKEIVISKDAMLGIFCPWAGGGSVLDIELEKDLTIPSSMIYDVQVEGPKLDNQYSLNSVYGLVGSAWKDAKSVRDINPQTKNPPLEDMIKDADTRRNTAVTTTHPNVKER